MEEARVDLNRQKQDVSRQEQAAFPAVILESAAAKDHRTQRREGQGVGRGGEEGRQNSSSLAFVRKGANGTSRDELQHFSPGCLSHWQPCSIGGFSHKEKNNSDQNVANLIDARQFFASRKRPIFSAEYSRRAGPISTDLSSSKSCGCMINGK